MDVFILLILIPGMTLAFAILTNLYREHRKNKFNLKPNCLLTRLPVVFLTGPRSIFYFRKYWNAYPEILAEHGYEVFTLNLPWRGPARSSRLNEYFAQQENQQKKYHFICDSFTANELNNLFDKSPIVASVTVLEDHHEKPITENAHKSFLLELSYKIHCRLWPSSLLAGPNDLGLHYPSSSFWLLEKMQEKAEQDFLR